MKLLNLTRASEERVLEEDISIHIFSTSATMIGVCLMVFGLFRIAFQLKPISKVANGMLSIDALLFLVACLFSYRLLRTRQSPRRETMERITDVIFMSALGLMALICCVITYEFV